MAKRKYEPGKVLTFTEAVANIEAGQYVYWHHKPQHPSWLISMRLHTLLWAARCGFLRESIKL